MMKIGGTLDDEVFMPYLVMESGSDFREDNFLR